MVSQGAPDSGGSPRRRSRRRRPMIPPAADRARGHLEAALDGLALAMAELPPARRRGRRGDWRARGVEVIRGDLEAVVAAGVPADAATVVEVGRLAERVAGLR